MAKKAALKGFGMGPANGLIAASTKPQKPGSGADNKFIASAIKHPGSLHRALGVPQGQKIAISKIEAAAKSADKDIARKARLALTLEGIGKK